jgi:hypothetical protein
MLEIQRKYIHLNDNFDVYFITFNNNQSEDIVLVDDIIYIKGEDTLINILIKTIKAYEFITQTLDKKYDYIIRTNISTLVHLNNLYQYLNTSPRNMFYSGGQFIKLGWPLGKNEISVEKQHLSNNYFHTKYYQGTSIILSIDIMNHILQNQHLIEYDIVDDVKIGLLIKDYLPDVYNNLEEINLPKTTFMWYQPDTIFIRNKTNDRERDVYWMGEIGKRLL